MRILSPRKKKNQMVLEGLQSTFLGIGEDVKQFITEKPLATAALGAAALGATALGVVSLVKRRKKARKRTKKGRSRDRKYISKQKHEQAYIRRKRKKGKKITRKRYKTKKSKKRVGKVYYTKNGQPYKILASGKARFIKGKRRTKR